MDFSDELLQAKLNLIDKEAISIYVFQPDLNSYLVCNGYKKTFVTCLFTIRRQIASCAAARTKSPVPR